MKNKRIILIIISSLFLTVSSYAQMGMGKLEDIKEMKNRSLIVVLQPENPKIIEKLKKKHHEDLIDVYKGKVADYNQGLQDAFTNAWPYQQKIEFKTWDEVQDLKKADSKEYAVIVIWQEGYGQYQNVFTPYLDWSYSGIVKGTTEDDDKDFWKESTYIRLTLIEKLMKNMPIAAAGLASNNPNRADLVAGIYNLKYYLDMRENNEKAMEAYREAKKISPKLKTETLLFRQSDLGKDFTKANIKSLYHSKFQVVADSIFDRNVVSKTPGMAVILTIPNYGDGPVIYSQQIFECETGTLLGAILPSIGKMLGAAELGGAGIGVSAGQGRINDKIVKKLVEQMEGK